MSALHCNKLYTVFCWKPFSSSTCITFADVWRNILCFFEIIYPLNTTLVRYDLKKIKFENLVYLKQMMVAKSFEVDDLVWAKMKGYSPWPGKIMVPPPAAKAKAKKHHHYVFFFGSDNHAWIPDECIELHNEKLIEKYKSNKKGGVLFQSAVETIVSRSKGISKYHRSKESFEMHGNEDESPKEHENNFDKFPDSDVRHKNKSPQSNIVQKKIKKKIPMMKKISSGKKLSLGKKLVRKRTHSPDNSEPESIDYPSKSFRHETIFTNSSDICGFSTNFRMDENEYANLVSNLPPNLTYTDCARSFTQGVLQRKYVDRPDTPPIDLHYQSEDLDKKEIEPTKKKIGFLGLGKIGQGIVKNLHQSGHTITIWNQTPEECQMFADKLNIKVADTPADVVEASDITFCCVSDADAAKQLVFGNCGILKEIESCTGEKKGYVEMTSMDPKVSEAIGHEIRMKGGRYLEAPLSGSRLEANEGALFILAAGDKALYDDCRSCLDAAAKKHLFVSADIGTASTLSIIHNMLVGTVYGAVAESLALVSRTGLKGEDFLDVLKDGVLNCTAIIEKGTSMLKNEYTSNISLKHMQKDLNLGLSLGDKIAQPTPIFAAANEVYKHCKSMRYGDHDVSAVYEGTRP